MEIVLDTSHLQIVDTEFALEITGEDGFILNVINKHAFIGLIDQEDSFRDTVLTFQLEGRFGELIETEYLSLTLFKRKILIILSMSASLVNIILFFHMT